MSTTLILDKEMDRLMTLCAYISQVASRSRLMLLPNMSFSPEHVKLCHQELLSMSENVEGSLVLLESLLAIERRNSTVIQPKKFRYAYTRDELLKLRHSVTPSLSIEMKHSLAEIVERESNYSMKTGEKSWRNIRTILI
jgi:septation ring formation regulator EzrA